ncbi:LGFP repeat-containing protein [Nocardia callitridis]|uniref:LGFP repeat-containing protein n=1 Tax=Nocardia callitridis TaxID=648753 RepID=UPI0031E6A092
MASSLFESTTVAGGQEFQHSTIYWFALTGAHNVQGAILGLFNDTGAEQGPLGYPDVLDASTVDAFTPGRNFFCERDLHLQLCVLRTAAGGCSEVPIRRTRTGEERRSRPFPAGLGLPGEMSDRVVGHVVRPTLCPSMAQRYAWGVWSGPAPMNRVVSFHPIVHESMQ